MEDNNKGSLSKKKIKVTGIVTTIGLMIATVVSTFHIETDTPTIQNSYEAVTEQKPYTVLVYMVGSTLEYEDENDMLGAATSDLNEMITAMSQEDAANLNQNMNLVIEVGGSKSWEKEELKDIQNARFCIDASGIDRKVEISKRSMGASETLSDFINYGVLSYPADQYILLFWDHGNGAIKGFGCDTLYHDDSLELDELNKGIEDSVMNQRKFSIIGFDACLMGNIETASILSDNAEYLLASAELEQQDGWDYDWISVFDNKDVSLLDIGKKVISEYDENYSKNPYSYSLAFSDLSKVEDINHAINTSMEPILQNTQESYKTLGTKRTDFTGYGCGNSSSTVYVPSLVDLSNLLEYLKVDNYQELIDNMVIYHCSSETSKDKQLSGLSIYVPSGTDGFLEDDLKDYLNSKYEADYIEYVKQYTKYLLDYDDQDWQRLLSKLDESTNVLQTSLPTDDLDSLTGAYLAVYGTLNTDEYLYLLTTDSDVSVHENGNVEAKLDTEYAAIKDEVLCMIELYNSEEYTQYQCPVLYNGEFCKMTIQYDYVSYDGEIISIIPVNEKDMPQKKLYTLQAGDKISPLYPLIRIEGAENGEKLDTDKIFTCGEDEYYIGNQVVMENDADGYISTVKKNIDDYQYGFLLINNKQQYTFTDIYNQN